MGEQYTLMHKNIPCGIIILDDDTGALTAFQVIDRKFAPFLGAADTSKMKKWWEARSVPGSRNDITELLAEENLKNTKLYLSKNLALSLTDTYWILPLDSELTWEQVKLYRYMQTEKEFLPYHNISSYDPNASLGGQMDKYWDMRSGTPILVKSAYRYYGQQAVNEVFATWIHERQNAGIPFVSYRIESYENGVKTYCDSFTDEHIEFVSAFEIMNSRKLSNEKSPYQEFINICVENGLPGDDVQKFLDYQTLIDFVISNIDEHFMNFGILRDADTLQFISPVPIFDSGNSMFFMYGENHIMSRVDLLKEKISSFYQQEERMLRCVRYKDIVDINRFPSKEETVNFFMINGIPEIKAKMIAANYITKMGLLRDFQNGESISVFHEERKERSK